MSAELCLLPATELARLIRAGDVSPVEAVDAFLRRIDERDCELNSFITVIGDEARERARQLGEGGSPVGPLHGVPVAVKDLFDLRAGVPNTFGCKLFAEFVPDVTATYIERLEAAGAIVLGKTNTPEFGHKGVTDNMLVGPTSTPFSQGKNAGGSSGGSAAAVAAGLASAAQGSDGGGSIRIPSAYCGVFGLKPSFGRVAQVARPNAFLHTPFIQSGPITRTVTDAAQLLAVMAGFHDRDPFSLPDPSEDFIEATNRGIKGLRVAYSPRLDVFPIDPQVGAVVAAAVDAFADAGAVLEEIEIGMPASQEELCALWIRQAGTLYAEMAESFKRAGLADLLGADRNGIPPQFAEMMEAAQSVSAIELKFDDHLRTQVFDAVQNCFETYDLLVTPTVGASSIDNAPGGNTVGPSEIAGETVDPLIGWCLTYPFNFTGHPAASIPGGLTEEGVPVGLQIIARRNSDATLLAASAAFEEARPWFESYERLDANWVQPAEAAPREG